MCVSIYLYVCVRRVFAKGRVGRARVRARVRAPFGLKHISGRLRCYFGRKRYVASEHQVLIVLLRVSFVFDLCDPEGRKSLSVTDSLLLVKRSWRAKE